MNRESSQVSSDSGGRKAIVFDLDDVLLMTIQWYWARWDMFKYVMTQLGFGAYGDEVVDTLNEIDMANVEGNGFLPQGFGWAMGETYEHYCRLEGVEPDPAIREAVEDIGHSVFLHKPIPYPGAADTLRWLRDRGHLLFCVTKGDAPNQTEKIRGAGLEGFFEEVFVVPDDKREALETVVERCSGEIGKGDVFFVGNSLKGDMKPAIELGINPVWIPCYTWPYEEEEIPGLEERVTKVQSIDELREIF